MQTASLQKKLQTFKYYVLCLHHGRTHLGSLLAVRVEWPAWNRQDIGAGSSVPVSQVSGHMQVDEQEPWSATPLSRHRYIKAALSTKHISFSIFIKLWIVWNCHIMWCKVYIQGYLYCCLCRCSLCKSLCLWEGNWTDMLIVVINHYLFLRSLHKCCRGGGSKVICKFDYCMVSGASGPPPPAPPFH